MQKDWTWRVLSQVRRTGQREKEAERRVVPAKPRHWKKGIVSHWARFEDHALGWDGCGGLVSVPRLSLGPCTKASHRRGGGR